VIERGERMHMVMTNTTTLSADTPKDLERVTALMQDDLLMASYSESK